VIVLGVEEGDARRMREHDVAARVKDLLCRDRALIVRDAVDHARCDLTSAADLKIPGPTLIWVVVKRSHSR
jgi:hypothetical protein